MEMESQWEWKRYLGGACGAEIEKYDKSLANRVQLGLNVFFTRLCVSHSRYSEWNNNRSICSGLYLVGKKNRMDIVWLIFREKKKKIIQRGVNVLRIERTYCVWLSSFIVSRSLWQELDGTFRMRLVRKYLQSTHKNSNF